MKAKILLLLVVSFASASFAAPVPGDLGRLLAKLEPSSRPALAVASPPGSPRFSYNDDGTLWHFSAVEGTRFRPARATAGKPEITARDFLKEHAGLFGVASPDVDFTPVKTREKNQRRYVSLQQTYAGLPVFASRVTVQSDATDGVEFVIAKFEHDTATLDARRLSLVPTLTADDAVARTRATVAAKIGAAQLDVTPPQLTLFAPSVLNAAGPVRLVWRFTISTEGEVIPAEEILLDAHNGEVVRRYSQHVPLLHRTVFDANNTSVVPLLPSRVEGGPASGNNQVNDAYNFLGDTYAFYRDHHGRDSVNGAGLPLIATVRFCEFNGLFQPPTCPPPGLAFWSSTLNQMFIGDGFVADDVIAHELTHGVTRSESGLIYENASGAMNESFSDIWGEFVDLSNGDNGPRWDIGEDFAAANPIRSMSDPTRFGHPDRLGSTLFTPPTSMPDFEDNDYGGVHSNSGINNKLCFLLTDGGTFNNRTVTGLGIDRVADLYYEVNAHLLTAGADWKQLYQTLRQAASNLGWSTAEQANLVRACEAVEITPNYVDKANNCPSPNGSRQCGVNVGGPQRTVSAGVNGASDGETLFVRQGSYNESNIRIAKNLKLRTYDGAVRIGR